SAVAPSGECDIVICHGRAEENPRYYRVRSAVRDLGLDLSRHQIFYSNNSAVLNGWRAIRLGRHNHVCNRLVARHRGIKLAELADVAHYRSVFVARRQWRGDDLGTI